MRCKQGNKRWFIIFGGLISLVLPAVACAQEVGTQAIARSEVEVTGGSLVIVTYVVLWVLLLGFLVAFFSHQRRFQQQLVLLESQVDQVVDQFS